VCFNATASFVGAGVVAAAGVVALALVREPRQIPFAALPLLFGVHQALEGLTWLKLGDAVDAQLHGWGVHAWVTFAWAILPLYVPWAVRLMEPDPRRRTLLLAPLAVGAALAVYMACLAVQPDIGVAVIDHNLDYQLGVPFSAVLLAVPYVFATCGGPMMSSYRWVIALGVGNFVAMAAAAYMQAADYSSLWCTFAAFLSLIVVGHFVADRRRRGRLSVPDPAPAR